MTSNGDDIPEDVQDKADHVDVLSPKSRRSLGISEIPFLMS
jgi:hypothetical protein